MRILVVTNGFPPRGQWGTEFYTLQLVRGLRERGHELAVLHADRSGSKPRFTLERVEEEVMMTVHDTGPGIPQEILPRIFDKFYKGAGGGSGLGLAIAKQIAEQHGGSLAVESVPGDTLFRLRLPAVVSDDG